MSLFSLDSLTLTDTEPQDIIKASSDASFDLQLCDGPLPMPADQVGIGAVCELAYPGEEICPPCRDARAPPSRRAGWCRMSQPFARTGRANAS